MVISCTKSKIEVPEEPLALSDIIIGEWTYTASRGWYHPFNEWHPESDDILKITFNMDGSVILDEIHIEEDSGTFEVNDSTNIILMTLEAGIYENPLQYIITSFDNDRFIRTFHTDEGPIEVQFERIE